MVDFSPDTPDVKSPEELELEQKKKVRTNQEAIRGQALAAANRRGRSSLRNALFIPPSAGSGTT